jgi:hypothetical protein
MAIRKMTYRLHMQVLLECCCIYKWKVHNGKIEIISFVVKICTFVLNLFLFIRYVLSSIIDMTITGTAYQSPAPGSPSVC